MNTHRVLVLSFDPLTEEMPGPAIRAWNLAAQLAGHHDVVLGGTAGASRTDRNMRVVPVSEGMLSELVGWADVIFAPTSAVRRHPVVVNAGKPLCIDMYIPTHLENLEALGEAGGEEHFAAVAHQVSVINDDLRAGDFFLCASERQRDFWLGALGTLGRLNPATYGSDQTMRKLIDVVPFGLPGEPPPAATGVIRREFAGIGPRDRVIIWGGGVYNWFDPLSVVRAVDALREKRPEIRLLFLGMRHPNPGIPEMRVAVELRRESDRLGLTGSHVFFNEGWVPYDERGSYLAEADVAVSTHLDHVETHFSFRTRVLDYIWAGLPMVLTEGDALSDEVAGAGLGIAVPPGSPDAVADAIDRLLDDPPSGEAIRAFGSRFSWSAVAGPLRLFCDDPYKAADRSRPRQDPPPRAPAAGAKPAHRRLLEKLRERL